MTDSTTHRASDSVASSESLPGRPDTRLRSAVLAPIRARAGTNRLRGAAREALFALPFLALSFLLSLHAWESPTTRWIGECCDPQQNMWWLRWMPFAIAHGTDPLITDYLNYPHGVNLMWNTSTPLAGLILSPLTETIGLVFAYNVLITVALALSGWCAFLALRRFTSSSRAAAAGALVYGFSPYMVLHATQNANLTMAFTPPLMLILFDETVIRRRHPPLRIGLLLGVLAGVQLLLSEEILASEALSALILSAVVAGMYPRAIRPVLPYAAEVLLTASLTFLVLCSWPLLIQFFGPQRVTGPIWPSGTFSTDIANLLVPTTSQAFFTAGGGMLGIQPGAVYSETTGFVGLPMLLLAGFTAGRWWPRPSVRAAALTGAILALLSFGPHLNVAGQTTGIPLPWMLIDRVPLFNDLLPERLTLYMFLSLAFLVAIFADMAIVAVRPRDAAVATCVLVGALLPLAPAQLPAWKAQIPPLFTHWSAARIPPGSVVLIAPRPNGGANAAGMLWQAASGDAFRMPDGFYFVPKPGGGAFHTAPPSTLLDTMSAIQFRGSSPLLTSTLRVEVASDLRAAEVRAVVVGPMNHRALMIAFFRRLFGRPPAVAGRTAYWSGRLP